MIRPQTIHRRNLLTSMLGGAALATVGASSQTAKAAATAKLKGNINHSACRWCYRGLSLEQLCEAAQRIGLKSIELLGPDDWPTLKSMA